MVRFCWTTLWNESQSDGRICVVSQMMSLDVINRHTVWNLICMLNHNVDNKERSRDDNLWLFLVISNKLNSPCVVKFGHIMNIYQIFNKT